MFKTIGNKQLVKLFKHMLRIFLFLKIPIDSVLRNIAFYHFSGGENIRDCKKTISDLYHNGSVFSILSYSVEKKSDGKNFDETLKAAIAMIACSNHSPFIPFIVIKPSSLGCCNIYQKIAGHSTLNDKENKEWLKIQYRFDTICTEADKTDRVRIMVDAEESWIQNGVDVLVKEMMRRYNTERVVIFNTVQMYRWDRLQYLRSLRLMAKEENFKVGVKLVRGSYMEKERSRAKAKGYQSPICITKERTDANFNAALRYCIHYIGTFELFSGTHNEKSVKLMIDLMDEYQIADNDLRIWFGQLLGMGDHISFNLAANGFNVAKCVPYGPVKEVIPYLLRRANENVSMKSQISRELRLILAEIKRRKTDFASSVPVKVYGEIGNENNFLD
ncbi:MAG: proline dehydrogenase family protein [Bacteroidota bacterium]